MSKRVHVYQDGEGGADVRHVIETRTGEKTVRWESRVGDGWLTGLNGHQPGLYRLPGLRKAKAAGERVWLAEGERDCDTLAKIGLVATTNPNGAAENWREEWLNELRGAHVVVLVDNDSPGLARGERLAADLFGIAESVVILAPLGGEAGSGFDVSDWAIARHLAGDGIDTMRADLEALRDKTPAWQPSTVEAAGGDPVTVPLAALAALSKDPPAAALGAALRAFHEATRGLDAIGAQVAREEGIRGLKGKVNAAASVIDAALGCGKGTDSQQGRIALQELQPASEPQDGRKLFGDLVATLERFMRLPPHASTAVALWVAAAHAVDSFELLPRLAFTSAIKRSGKTRLLGIVEALVPRPLNSVVATSATTFRLVELRPTLLFDEVDELFKGEKQDLVAVLNAGFEMRGRVPRCVGESNDVKIFSCYAPAVLCGIDASRWPDTIVDRCIVVKLERKVASDQLEALRREQRGELATLGGRLTRWIADTRQELESAYAARLVVPALASDRAADCWEPLLAIAGCIGGDWPSRAMNAAVALSGDALAEESDIRERLLNDLRAVFDERGEAWIESSALVAALAEDDSSPWADWRGRPITAAALARLLRPFGVRPVKLRHHERTVRAWRREDLERLWKAYANPPTESATSATRLKTRNLAHFQGATKADSVAVSCARKSLEINDVAGVAVSKGGEAAVAIPGRRVVEYL